MDAERQSTKELDNAFDTVASFLEGHAQMLGAIFDAQVSPSRPALEQVSEQIKETRSRLEPFVVHEFFKATQNDMAVDLAVSRVRGATEEIIIKKQVINAQWHDPFESREGVVETAIAEILEDKDDDANVVSVGLCNEYIAAAENIEQALLNSEPIQDFLAQQESNAKLKDRLISMGFVMVGAFVATKLAQQNRR